MNWKMLLEQRCPRCAGQMYANTGTAGGWYCRCGIKLSQGQVEAKLEELRKRFAERILEFLKSQPLLLTTPI